MLMNFFHIRYNITLKAILLVVIVCRLWVMIIVTVITTAPFETLQLEWWIGNISVIVLYNNKKVWIMFGRQESQKFTCYQIPVIFQWASQYYVIKFPSYFNEQVNITSSNSHQISMSKSILPMMRLPRTSVVQFWVRIIFKQNFC